MDDQLAKDTARLVDAVCAAATAAAIGRQEDLREAIRQFADPTKALSQRAAQIGKECGNGAAVAKALMDLANAVNNCAEALSKDGTGQRVAECAIRVGSAVEALAAATDQSARAAVMRCIEKARTIMREDLNEEVDGYPISHIEGCVRDVKLTGDKAASATVDIKKRDLLRSSLDELVSVKDTLVWAKNNKQYMQKCAAARSALRVLEDIEEATRIVPNFGGKLDRALKKIHDLIRQADTLHNLGQSILDAKTKEELVATATQAARAALQLVKDLELAAAEEPDPVRRNQMNRAIQDLKADAVELLQSAKATAAARPGREEEEARQRTEQAIRNVDKSIERALAIAGAREGKEGLVLEDTCIMLNDMVEEMCARDPPARGEELARWAEDVDETTARAVKDAKALAAVTADPRERAEILTVAKDLREQGTNFSNDVRTLARNGGDSSQINDLDSKHAFTSKLHDLEAIARGESTVAKQRIEQERQRQEAIRREEERLHQESIERARREGIERDRELETSRQRANDSELVLAAKEQAMHAATLAREAAGMINSITDPKQRSRFEDAIRQMPDACRELIAAAAALDRNPDDPEAIRAFEEAQARVQRLVQQIIEASGRGQDSEMASAMREMHEAAEASARSQRETAAACDSIYSKIDKFVADIDRLSPAEIAARSNEISQAINELCAQLRAQAASAEDPALAEQLIALSKILKDKVIQIRMISAVKVACGGSDKGSNQVASACRGLQTGLKETSSVMNAAALASRARSANHRARAYQNLVALWRR